MLDIFKNMFRKKEDARQPAAIGFDGIPALLEQKKQEAASLLAKETDQERSGIRDAAGQMKAVIQALVAAEFNEEIHPKLRSIAQKSLPLYTKSIQAALEKPLPDEPAEFYAAAADLLKTCINSATGQGKYLRVVFPDEMKAAAACVAQMGRSINAMNRPLGEYKATMARVDEAGQIHAAIVDIGVDCAKSEEKEERMKQRMQEIAGRIASLERSLADLERERSGTELSGRAQEILARKKERDVTVRRYAAVSMTASHVLRKAEKIARRKNDPSDGRVIGRAVALLSDHAIPDSGDLVGALSAAFVPARRMIDAGEIVLKNKEERALFSTEDSFSEEIRKLCAAYAEQDAACDVADAAFCSHPVIARHADLKKELQTLSDTLAKETEAYRDLVQWRDSLRKNIPELRNNLKKSVEMICSGSDVQIHFPD